MNVHLLNPRKIDINISNIQCGCYDEISITIPKYQVGVYQFVENPVLADIIIAPIQFCGYGNFFQKLRRSELFKQFKLKTYIYCTDDNQFPFLPGIYPALVRNFYQIGWAKAGHYISSHIYKFDFDDIKETDKSVLFSFIGSSGTHPVREKILNIKHNNALIVDTAPKNSKPWYEKDAKEVSDVRGKYAGLMRKSKFSLCPRGVSPSSIRLFEAMQSYCVPVIISDEQVLPEGPDWDSFIVKIKENEVEHIPEILTKLELNSWEMGKMARKTWEDFFSPESSTTSLIKWCVDLHENLDVDKRKKIERKIRLVEYFSYQHNRIRFREWKNS